MSLQGDGSFRAVGGQGVLEDGSQASFSWVDHQQAFLLILCSVARTKPGRCEEDPGQSADLFGMKAQRAAAGRGRGWGKEEGPLAVLKRRPTAFMHMISDELVAWQQQPLPPSIHTPQAACNVCDIFLFTAETGNLPPSLAEDGTTPVLPPPAC